MEYQQLTELHAKMDEPCGPPDSFDASKEVATQLFVWDPPIHVGQVLTVYENDAKQEAEHADSPLAKVEKTHPMTAAAPSAE
eukprot:2439240-Amphidinium_carterae.1